MKHKVLLPLEEKQPGLRVSVPLDGKVLREIDARAERAGVSRSAFLTRLVRYGLEAEQQKREQFIQKIQNYRDCPDPAEAERLVNEIGEMIFGR